MLHLLWATTPEPVPSLDPSSFLPSGAGDLATLITAVGGALAVLYGVFLQFQSRRETRRDQQAATRAQDTISSIEGTRSDLAAERVENARLRLELRQADDERRERDAEHRAQVESQRSSCNGAIAVLADAVSALRGAVLSETAQADADAARLLAENHLRDDH